MKTLIFAAIVIVAIADPFWVVLNDFEVTIVKNTWHSISNQEVEILAAIFKDNPSIQAHFPGFVNKNVDDLKGTAKFTLHATRIVGFFSEYISLLGQEQTQAAIKTILNQLGQTHRNRGVPKSLFDKFRSSLIRYLKAHADGWNDNFEHVWNDAFDKMYSVIYSALDGRPVV